MNNKKAWLGLLISAVFLYLAFRNSDFAALAERFRQTDYFWVLTGVPFLFLMTWLRAIRWRFLLAPMGRARVGSLFGAIMIGYMLLNLLPLHIGEFVRVYVVGKREKMKYGGVLATLMLERIFDGLTVILILFATFSLLPLPIDEGKRVWLRTAGFFALLGFLGALAFLAAVRWKLETMVRLTEWALGRWPGARDAAGNVIRSFASGLDVLKSARPFAGAALFSLALWLANGVCFWVVMFGFGEGQENLGTVVGFGGSLFVLVAQFLAVLIPAGPGFVGTFEMAVITALTAFGTARSLAESYAVILHLAISLPFIITGIVYLNVFRMSFREVRHSAKPPSRVIEKRP